MNIVIKSTFHCFQTYEKLKAYFLSLHGFKSEWNLEEISESSQSQQESEQSSQSQKDSEDSSSKKKNNQNEGSGDEGDSDCDKER